jgi:putative DNA primase/helicase
VGRVGKKENVKYLNAFHAEVDYGDEGHKKSSPHKTREDALNAIQNFHIGPTIIVHSGGGFHCYWVLSKPLKVEEDGIEALESINKSLTQALGGDPGTQDISRVLRVPGTYNFKNPDNPRKVTLFSNSGRKYSFNVFLPFIREKQQQKTSVITNKRDNPSNMIQIPVGTASIDTLPISPKIKELIQNGNDGTYPTRSEADMAVITVLVNKGINEEQIKAIYLNPVFHIGEKYRSHNAPDAYLRHTIEKAKERSVLSEEEMVDPLFASGAIYKDAKRGYHLRIVMLQEYIAKKFRLKILDKEKALFKYNGKCYEELTPEYLNMLCQRELGNHRELFKKSSLEELIHYAVGKILMDSEKAQADQLNYLTLQNGLFKMDEGKLVSHNPDIFTTNLLPYDYDPSGTCPRFLQFLDEVFWGDKDKINSIQEMVGYAFHKSIPTPAVFFLVGAGSNGKSVFINTISNLVGKENTSNVSFASLSDEHFLIQLFQKMINISGETPHSKQINTDLIKAVTSGDYVTGRDLYKAPMTFRPYAKHYLAMNKVPNITDTSHGMWRRIWVIEFPRTFSEEEMDRDLESKLSYELSGIFNWALEGYRRLRGRNFRLTESQSMKLSKEDYRKEVDTVRSFANEALLKSPHSADRVKFKDLYQMYVNYCQGDGKKEFEKKPGFKRGLEDLGYKVTNSTRDGNQMFVYNVKLVGFDE